MVNAGDQMIQQCLRTDLWRVFLKYPLFFQNRDQWGSSLGNMSMFGLQTCREDVAFSITLVAFITVAVALCKMKFAKV